MVPELFTVALEPCKVIVSITEFVLAVFSIIPELLISKESLPELEFLISTAPDALLIVPEFSNSKA
jgi:hypothetical protein